MSTVTIKDIAKLCGVGTSTVFIADSLAVGTYRALLEEGRKPRQILFESELLERESTRKLEDL